MKMLTIRKCWIVAAAAMVLLGGCQKENTGALPEGALTLTGEGYGEGNGAQKTSVAGTTVRWDGDEVVRLNGATYTVVVSGGTAYVQGGSLKDVDTICGYYPASILKAEGSSTAPTVVIPTRYECRYDSGRQVLQLPMAAYRTEASGTIRFLHLTAGVKVVVRNSTGHDDFWVDSVEVASDSYRLGGEVTLDLAANDYGLAATSGSGAVRVCFPFESVNLAGGSTLDVQVPILPVGNDHDLVVRIYAHSKVGSVLEQGGVAPANYSYHYGKGAVPQQALTRNMLMEARCDVAASGGNMTTIDRGLFSIANGTKVHFSQGNVQYVGGEWRFAEHQYDKLGSQSDGNRDLFGWGTGNAPDMTGVNDSAYGTFTDWGNNTISGTTGWRTMSSEEWNYLLNTRSMPTGVERYSVTRVNDLLGLVIFPDGYEHPAGVKASTQIDLDGWAKMEAAGAVFLPADGIRNGTQVSNRGSQGNYWSSTYSNTNAANRMLFSATDFAAYNYHAKHLGCSVRVVRVAE